MIMTTMDATDGTTLPPTNGLKVQSPFSRLIYEKTGMSVNRWADTLQAGRGTALHLAVTRGNEVPPNSPMLRLIAGELGVPVEEIASFAHGQPMTQAFVTKIESQVRFREKGRVPRKRPARHTGRRGGSAPNDGSLAAYVRESGVMTLSEIGRRLGVANSHIQNIGKGNFSPNHPIVERIAKVLEVSPDTIAAFAKKAYNPRWDWESPRKKGVLSSVRVENADTPAGKHAGGRPRGATSNKVKRGALQLREVVRALVTTVNTASMTGERDMPPIPVADMRILLADYFEAKGVRDTMLVSARFSELFD